jgi:peptidoglycan biosynthesis protein MviN/MurJ (putative lipid II flippase)
VRAYIYGFGLAVVVLWLHEYLLRIVFFHARFSEAQYAQMSRVLRLIPLGLPAAAQVYIWTRVNAVRRWNHLTLAAAAASLGIIAALSGLQPRMGVEGVAALWALGVCVQALLLIAGNYYGLGMASGRFGRWAISRAAAGCAPCAAFAAAVWLGYSHPQWQIALIGGLNMLLVIHCAATGWELLRLKIAAPAGPELILDSAE